MAEGPGPVGYLFHRSSLKLVHPSGGSSNPGNDTELVLHSGKDNPQRLQVRFIPVQGAGHFGYIEHVTSGKIVHPYGGGLNPGDDTQLVYHSARHSGALFAFNDEDEYIMHGNGLFWHPSGGSPIPGDDTPCVLHQATHAAMKFYFGDLNGTKISPYPNPNLSGTWKVIKAFIDPKASHAFKQSYKVGKVKKETETEGHSWSVSVGAAIKFFSASAEYSGFVEKTSENTWSSEYEETATIEVEAGKSIVVWQFVFGMQQYGEDHSFQSSIIGDTYSLDVKPSI